MPKSTFNQISMEKRERVLSQAAKLFAQKGFAGTDMALLASWAGVSKGSLYTYFASKKDLYLHVCRDGMQRSRRAIYGSLDSEATVYHQVEHIFYQGLKFCRAHPEYMVLYLNMASPGLSRFTQELSPEVEEYTADHLKRVIKRDQAAGLVRGDCEPKLTAFVINSLYIMFMASLVSPHFQFRLQEYMGIKNLSARSLDEHVVDIIQFIHSMLRP